MAEKTVAEKLFIKAGYRVLLIGAPQGYEAALGELPDGARVASAPLGDVTLEASGEQVDFVQLFVDFDAELRAELLRLKPLVRPGGLLWVTYHKGTSKTKTDMNRDTIRAYAESIGFKAVAVVSVDEDWSALRLKSVEA